MASLETIPNVPMAQTVHSHNTVGAESPDAGRERENSYHHFRHLRECYDVQITKSNSMNFMDYVLSLELDPHVYKVAQRKRLSVHDYVHFFDIEVTNAVVEKSTTKWTIRRRFVDFTKLEKNLQHELIEGGKLLRTKIPPFSAFYNTRAEGAPELFLESAEKYLKALLSVPEIRAKSLVLYEFLELSLLPMPNAPQKFKEGYLKKKGGGRFKNNRLKIYCSVFFANWQERWFILTEEGIIYAINSSSTKAREMLLFDQTFQIEYGRKATGSESGLSIHTSSRRLNLQASDLFEALDWVGAIQKAAKASPYTKINRFFSFAPVRDPVHYCQWYVDSEGYFEDLLDSLNKAKKEIFITDWWLSPEVALKRPVPDSDSEHRLDKVLAKIANTGVKVYIIVYHEVRMVMYNDSEHTRNALESLSENITVLKHPSEPFFSWSHHEKLVVIDQQVGFVGGFDLCFGRMDTSDHPLNDPAFDAGTGETFPGQDYANPRLIDFKNVREHHTPLIDKSSQPRMPFHDAMVKVIGPVVGDMCRHFIQYWNHVEVDVYGKGEEAPLPMNNVQPPMDPETEKKENATMHWRGAFRKIFGMRNLAAAAQGSGAPTNPLQAKAEAAGLKLPPSDNALKRTQSTLPSLNQRGLGSYNQLNETRDEMQVTVHDNNKNLSKFAPPVKEDVKGENKASSNTSLDEALVAPRRYPKSGPNKPENQDAQSKNPEQDTLLNKTDHKVLEGSGIQKVAHDIKEKGSEIVEDIKDKGKEIVNRVTQRAPVLNTRQVQTMHTIGQPIRNPVGDDDDSEYRMKYANMLKSIRDKERNYDKEFQNSRSKRRQVGGPGGPSSVFAQRMKQGKNRPQEEKFKKEMTDQFYEKNMLQLLFSPKEKQLQGTIACQMVRSASKWSLGLNSNEGNIENSIQNAYIELIQHSKKFIYIENQFFMSGTAGKVVQNEVANAILLRIMKAHSRGERFRVIIFLPLVPAFEGDIIDSKAALLRVQMHWQYMTICRGGESIYESLRNQGINPEDYIQFYSLRTHARMKNGTPVTEMIYIHSKILVIDDDILLIGSANINDRSLQGSRDSEIAMIFEDTKKVPSYMDGESVEVSEFAVSFRKRLLAEHIGLTEDEVQDPMSEEFTNILNERAQTNTDIYREIFACYPDDNIKKLTDMDEFNKTQDLNKYDELAPKIKGHVVWFPLDFCSEDSLTAPMNTMEYFIPDQTFV